MKLEDRTEPPPLDPAVPRCLGRGRGPPRPGRRPPAGVEFFEKKVRPVLVDIATSATRRRRRGGSSRAACCSTRRDGLLKGGDTGPAVVPGKPDESLLIKAVRYADDDLKMPPKGSCRDAAIADLAKWVEMGAPDPRNAATAARRRPPANG